MELTELKTNDVILKRIKEAAKRKPTEEEIRKQRISFIYGSISGSSGVTRDHILSVLDAQEGKI